MVLIQDIFKWVRLYFGGISITWSQLIVGLIAMEAISMANRLIAMEAIDPPMTHSIIIFCLCFIKAFPPYINRHHSVPIVPQLYQYYLCYTLNVYNFCTRPYSETSLPFIRTRNPKKQKNWSGAIPGINESG